MAIEHYSLNILKDVGLKNAQLVDSTYDLTLVDAAYKDAAAKAGYENPASTDTDFAIKQSWLIRLMTRYFYEQKLMSNVGKFDVEGLKLGQVAKGLREMLKQIDDEFAKAKESGSAAHLFINAADYFNGSVSAVSGLIDDTVGRDYRG